AETGRAGPAPAPATTRRRSATPRSTPAATRTNRTKTSQRFQQAPEPARPPMAQGPAAAPWPRAAPAFAALVRVQTLAASPLLRPGAGLAIVELAVRREWHPQPVESPPLGQPAWRAPRLPRSGPAPRCELPRRGRSAASPA